MKKITSRLPTSNLCNRNLRVIGLPMTSLLRIPKMKRNVIAVCQMTITDDKAHNFNNGKELVRNAKQMGAKMAFLPEACDYIANDLSQKLSLAEDITAENSMCSMYQELARTEKIWLSLGGLHRKCAEDEASKCRISQVIIDDLGQVRSVYDKCHLYSVDIPGRVTLKETDAITPGKGIVDPTDTCAGKVGSMICYDMRFPLLSNELQRRGADILTYPSAFTVPTGHAHWHAILRARAIETQCYVVAAALTGNKGVRSFYGHSLIVDPWGTVLADAGDRAGVATATVDLEYLSELRLNMPILQHTRRDLF